MSVLEETAAEERAGAVVTKRVGWTKRRSPPGAPSACSGMGVRRECMLSWKDGVERDSRMCTSRAAASARAPPDAPGAPGEGRRRTPNAGPFWSPPLPWVSSSEAALTAGAAKRSGGSSVGGATAGTADGAATAVTAATAGAVVPAVMVDSPAAAGCCARGWAARVAPTGDMLTAAAAAKAAEVMARRERGRAP